MVNEGEGTRKTDEQLLLMPPPVTEVPKPSVEDKEKITNQKKIDWALYIAWGSLIFSLVGVFWTGYDHIFIDRADLGVNNFEIAKEDWNQEQDKGVLNLSYNIQNFGKSVAKNIKVEVFIISFEDNDYMAKVYSDTLSNPIYPGTNIPPFGLNTFTINKNGLGKSVALVFDFDYFDTLTERKSQFWYKYTLGEDKVFTLLGSDKQKVLSKYESLKK